MSLNVWLAFALTYVVITLSPGPNVLLVIHNSLKYGFASTLTTISGNLASQLLIVLLVASGVAVALITSPNFFLILKAIGTLFLMWLGIQQIRAAYYLTSHSTSTMVNNASEIAYSSLPRGRIFWQAFFVSISNPQALIFFSAFMPQFIDPLNPLTGQFAIMYLTISILVTCIHIVYSVLAIQVKPRVKHPRWVKLIKYLAGIIFVLLGLKLLVSDLVAVASFQ